MKLLSIVSILTCIKSSLCFINTYNCKSRYSQKNKYNIHYGGEKKPPTTFKEDVKIVKKKQNPQLKI